ncbi:MAG: Phosphoribosylglycinamide formyltransferase, partial [uncultured Nocardioidaceae bacterium]
AALHRPRTGAPRRAGVGLRHQPAGAAGRGGRRRLRGGGGGGRLRPRRHRGARPRRACRRPDLRPPGEGPPRPRGVGRGADRERARARARPRRARGLHEARRAGLPACVRGTLRQHPSRAVPGLPRDARACRCPDLRGQGRRRDAVPRRRRRGHRADRRADGGAGARRRRRRRAPRAHQGRRASDARRRRGAHGPRRFQDPRQEGAVRPV